jgi:hypothetical protein
VRRPGFIAEASQIADGLTHGDADGYRAGVLVDEIAGEDTVDDDGELARGGCDGFGLAGTRGWF